MKNSLTKNFIPTYDYILFNNKLSVMGLQTAMQDVAIKHYEHIGASHDDMLKIDNAFFVIGKLKIKFVDNLPCYDEKFSVTTFPMYPEKFKMDRQYVCKCNNKIFAVAKSEWYALNADNHMIVKVENIKTYPIDMKHKTKQALADDFLKIDANYEEKDYCYTKKIMVSDLDINKHLNNVNFTKLAIDCFSASELDEFNLKSYEMNFVSEANEGDILDLYKIKIDENNYIIICVNKLLKKLVFKCIFGF